MLRRTRSLRRPSGRRPGGQPGPRGHTCLRVEQPDEVVTHAPALCRGCDASLVSNYLVKCENRQVIELPPTRPWVVEHRALTKRCRDCDELTKGRFPKGVRAAVQYRPGLRARAVYLVNYQLLPYRRAAELLQDFFSCPISPGSLRRIIAECAASALLTKVEFKRRLKQAPILHVDETGLRVEGAGRFVHVVSTPRCRITPVTRGVVRRPWMRSGSSRPSGARACMTGGRPTSTTVGAGIAYVALICCGN